MHRDDVDHGLDDLEPTLLLIGDRVERVRLIGIDTPETKRPDTPVECFGPEATSFIQQLLPIGTRGSRPRRVRSTNMSGSSSNRSRVR